MYKKDKEISHNILIILNLLIKNFGNSYSLIFNKNLFSNAIMYKTWNENHNMKIVNDIIEYLEGNINKFKVYVELFSEEFTILKQLCEHECIREEIKIKLIKFFNILN
jgi:hypothetical protein